MKKATILLLITFVIGFFSYAQSVDFNNYQILKSSGTIPLDFSSIIDQELKAIDSLYTVSTDKKKKKNKKDQQDFVATSTYSLGKLLRSGAVIYNDPVGAYLTKVLKTVLEANNINDEVTVYFIRAEVANAYAMDHNFIFFTAGLLSQVTSEAQIAMILSHEYVHFRNKHNRSEYIENRSIVRDYKKYKTSSTQAKLLMASYSREMETEADAQGFDLFANTNYNLEGALQAFDVLRFSDLPFEDVPYNKQFLGSADLVFPEELFLDEIPPIEYNLSEEENEDEEKFKTHPHIGTRKVAIQDMMQNKNSSGRTDFIVGENEFYNSRKIARYEICRLYLLEREYEKAFYSAYLLLQEEPNSLYLKKVILRSLYGLTKFSNAKKFNDVHTAHKKIQGESKQVNYFMNEMDKEELNLTAVHYAWYLYKDNKSDPDVSYILKDLVYDACKYNKLTPYSLKKEHPDTATLKTDSVGTSTDSTDIKKTNKYEKIVIVNDDTKGSNKKGSKKTKRNFIDYAFVSALQDSEFQTVIRDQYLKWQSDLLVEEEAKNKTKKKGKFQDDEIDEERNIDRMLVTNPVILKVDMRKDQNKIYDATKKKRVDMINNFQRLSTKAGIQSTIFNPTDINSEDVDLLNDMALLNTCTYEMITLPDKINMLPTDNLEVKNLAIKYDTPYFANIGVVTFIEKKRGVLLAVAMGVVTMGFLLPYTVYVLAKPEATTLIYLSVYDAEENKYVFSDVQEVKSRGSQDVMGSLLYDMIIRMKK